MRIPRWGVCLLGVVCCGFVGCSQTGLLRPNGVSDLKTQASVNGKPVSTVAGEPGSGSSTREDADPDLPPAAGARISGRVFDEDGRAVPNARVRLGVGGSAGGRVNFATTDRSGAFTLHGLRPGMNYTLIAEYQGDDGRLSGSIQARAPETGVRLTLASRDSAETESRGSKILPARVRSTLFPDEADGFPAPANPQVRPAEEPPAEEPPAEEATSYPPRPKRSSSTTLASTNASSSTVRTGWTVRQRPSPSSAATARARNARNADDPRDGPPAPAELDGADDNGENPLPPALEPVDSTSPRSVDRRGSTATGRNDVRLSSSRRNVRTRQAPPSPDQDVPDANRDPGSEGSAPRPIPEDALSSATDVAPASSAGGGEPTTADAADPPIRRSANTRRSPRTASTSASRSRDTGQSNPADARETNESSDDNAPRPRPNRRPTWRELSISPDDVPVDESVRRSSADEVADDRDAVVRAGGPSSQGLAAEEPGATTEARGTDVEPATMAITTATATAADEARMPQNLVEPQTTSPAEDPRPRRTRPMASSPAAARQVATAAASNPNEPACRLEPGHRRIAELRLPGLDGRMVSVGDIDADLILLDFWGSWCRECNKSIEHHRDVQAQLGGKTLQVVGIACEKGSTVEARQKSAATAVRKLGINYPVLVTSMDGACPVQKALQVQFYPTMVLLDREGNILQFEQGATDNTLGRIDRAIAKAVRDGGSRGGY
jgi:Carboxypeptidase regulatory-like domain/AhpC/TSA family